MPRWGVASEPAPFLVGLAAYITRYRKLAVTRRLSMILLVQPVSRPKELTEFQSQ
jgi:hypothetical protein